MYLYKPYPNDIVCVCIWERAFQAYNRPSAPAPYIVTPTICNAFNFIFPMFLMWIKKRFIIKIKFITLSIRKYLYILHTFTLKIYLRLIFLSIIK